MRLLQKNFRQGSPVDALISVQRILSQRVVLLQWWQNVGCPDEDEDDNIGQRFLGRASRTTGADTTCTCGACSSLSSSPSARALLQLVFRILVSVAAVAVPALIGDSTRASIDAARLLPLPNPEDGAN